jgi:ParB/RepB/Spo0J family partition protein
MNPTIVSIVDRLFSGGAPSKPPAASPAPSPPAKAGTPTAPVATPTPSLPVKAGTPTARPGDSEPRTAFIPVTQIAREKQVRENFDADALDRLSATVRELGILQPLVVREGAAPGQYTLIAGERRLLAAQEAGLDRVPVTILPRGVPVRRLQLVENSTHVDLRPLEQARAFAAEIAEKNFTAADCARAVGVHETTVTTALRLLDVPEEIKVRLEKGQITKRKALSLARKLQPRAASAGRKRKDGGMGEAGDGQAGAQSAKMSGSSLQLVTAEGVRANKTAGSAFSFTYGAWTIICRSPQVGLSLDAALDAMGEAARASRPRAA